MCSVNFWHQQDSHSLFKGSIAHLTSYMQGNVTNLSVVRWPM